MIIIKQSIWSRFLFVYNLLFNKIRSNGNEIIHSFWNYTLIKLEDNKAISRPLSPFVYNFIFKKEIEWNYIQIIVN